MAVAKESKSARSLSPEAPLHRSRFKDAAQTKWREESMTTTKGLVMTFALFAPYISPAVMLAGMWWFRRNAATKDDLKEMRSDVGQLKVDVAILKDRGLREV
jgi:hypothetical protein